MALPSISASNASKMWAYERWSVTTPDVTVTGRVSAADAVRATPPSLLHRVDTWQTGSVSSDLNAWYDRSAWSTSASSSTDPLSLTALTAPVQQFIVNPGATQLASMSPVTLANSVVAAASSTLGLSAGSIAAQLSAGKSLSDLAADTNTSHGDLVNAISAALPDLRDPVLQAYAAEQLATTPGPIGAQPLQVPASAGGDQTQVLALSLDATTNLLSTTRADLMAQLSQGSNLSTIADAMGVSHADLIAAVQADLPPQTPGWTDTNALAEQIAGDVTSTTEAALPPVAPPPPSGQEFTLDNGFGPQTLTMSLDATAATLSTSPRDLMRQLSQGASLYSIADGMGVAHGDVVNALESDLPAQTPGWTDVTSLADKIASATNTVTIAPPPSSAQQFTLDNGFGPQTLTMSLDATAHLLSTTSSDLMLQLSRGTSLYTIADAQGVAHGDVVTALESDLPAQTPGWTDVTALADKIASSTGSVTIAPPQSGTQQFALNNAFGPQTMTIPLDATASLLSTTPGDLMNQLSQGATLYSIADAQGVARGDLVTALEADLPAQTPGWTDIAALADQIASTSTGPVAAATSSGTQQFALNNAFGPQTMTMPLDATASLLSTTPADLMNQLSQGASLYSIADAQGVARADVMTALEADLPAETPGWTDVAALADQLASSTTSTTTPPTQL